MAYAYMLGFSESLPKVVAMIGTMKFVRHDVVFLGVAYLQAFEMNWRGKREFVYGHLE